MLSAIIKANTDIILNINGVQNGVLYKGESVTAPLSNTRTVVGGLPIDACHEPIWCVISGKCPRLNKCSSRLTQFTDEIYELELILPKKQKAEAPILINEARWGRGECGLCGGFFVFESCDGKRMWYDKRVIAYEIASDEIALLHTESGDVFVNSKLNVLFSGTHISSCVPKRDGIEFDTGVLGMEDFTAHIHMDNEGRITSSLSAKNEEDVIRIFVQAVRLNARETAERLTAPDLNMMFEEIRAFLGAFDKIDEVRYIPHEKNAIALRYVIDESNYRYIPYEFELKNNDGKILVNDIIQL